MASNDAFCANADRGYAFLVLAKHAPQVPVSDIEKWVERTLDKAGLPPLSTIKQDALTEMGKLSMDIVDGPLAAFRNAQLAIGKSLFEEFGPLFSFTPVLERLEGRIGNHSWLPSGFISTGLALWKRSSSGRPGEPRPPPAAFHLQTQAEASAPARARSVVLDRVVRGVEGVATSLVHCSSRHGGALAARKIPAVLGAAFKQIGKNRAASRQFSDSHIDSHFGASQSLVACAPHSWRTEEARNRGLRTDGVAHPADRQAATLADLENLPTESCRRDRRDRFLHGADDLPAGIVRVPGDRASAEKSTSLWGHRTSNRRMDRSASYRSFF